MLAGPASESRDGCPCRNGGQQRVALPTASLMRRSRCTSFKACQLSAYACIATPLCSVKS